MATKKKTAGKPGPKRQKKIDEQNDATAKAAAVVVALSGKQTRYLRGLGHHLEPTVQVGKEGITDGVVAAAEEALRAHELIKVKVQQEAPLDRKEAAEALAEQSSSFLAQTLGRTFLLYKRRQHKPTIVLPK